MEQEEAAAPELADEITIATGRYLYYGSTQWHIIHGSLMVWEPLIYPDENLNPRPVPGCLLGTQQRHDRMDVPPA